MNQSTVDKNMTRRAIKKFVQNMAFIALILGSYAVAAYNDQALYEETKVEFLVR